MTGGHGLRPRQKSDGASGVPALPPGYGAFLEELKERIRNARVRASLSANRELILLYWHIGNQILERQKSEGWGAKVVSRLSSDLMSEFPEMKGFSRTNLLYMRALAEAFPEEEFVQQAVGQIPWGHNTVILNKVKGAPARQWYIRKVIQHGWSRDVLAMQIETRLYEREAVAEKITNFPDRLPPLQSDLAQQVLKDPYVFDFLSLGQEAHEREIERELTTHITRFLLELGAGFAFVGRQYHVEVEGDDFFLDLLFYHLKLRCYVVIELKAGKFKPEFAGQLNFYLSLVDSTLKAEMDNPSIGILLCREKNRLVAEYSLRDMTKPMGVAEYRLVAAIPEELRFGLPTVEELESKLASFET